MTDDHPHRARVAERAARAGAAVARDLFRTDLAVETKDGKTDVVTRADREAQDAVVETIREAFPAETVVGEEHDTPMAVPAAWPAWVVDPIDGTNNYVRGDPVWTTSVAVVVDGEAVAAANLLPVVGDDYLLGPDGPSRNGTGLSVSDRTDPERLTLTPLLWWNRRRREEYARACTEIVQRFGDLRRVGSAQAALSLVAAGGLDGALTNVASNPWDTVAGVGLVRAAGGRVTDVEGERWTPDARGLVASNGVAHEDVLAAARAVDGAR